MLAVQDGEKAYLEKDFTKAREIWEPIAESGDAEAEAWLGALYANGLGVQQDAARAFEFYRRSAEHGNPLAANNVGAMYAKGDGIAREKSRFPLLAAYDMCLKCSHYFNILDARGAISVTERVGVIARVRALAVGIARAWMDQQYGSDTKSDKKEKVAAPAAHVKKEKLAPVGS